MWSSRGTNQLSLRTSPQDRPPPFVSKPLASLRLHRVWTRDRLSITRTPSLDQQAKRCHSPACPQPTARTPQTPCQPPPASTTAHRGQTQSLHQLLPTSLTESFPLSGGNGLGFTPAKGTPARSGLPKLEGKRATGHFPEGFAD